MAVLKCKMCGGELTTTEEESVCECEYCGTKQTIPKIDDQQRAAAFDRGNHFRRLGEFDKALAVYERIVQEDENDAEAHWCCALCRFGIEYVQDPVSKEYLPTCHRASFDNFLEDVDYQAALDHADSAARQQYKRDGEQIAAVIRDILTTVQKEEPFDVFICYKESDENGERTVDSTLAQDIYYQLTEEGFRVFFSRITLEDKMGQKYEPYIFAALHSSKVMVVVGTKPEYLNAVWVKNEWSRYLVLMKQDRKRLLLPCFRDMDPYDLPEQLSVLQSYDMSKIGFIQDLIRGVSKVLDVDRQKSVTVVKESVAVQGEGGSNLTALLKRGNMSLEDGDWDKADGFFEQALNIDAECAEAYLGKALAEKRCSSLQMLVELWKRMDDPTLKTLTACSEDTDKIDAIARKYVVPDYLSEKTIRQSIKEQKFDFTYQSATDSYCMQQNSADVYFSSDKLMGRAVRFASENLAVQIEAARKEIRTAFDSVLTRAQQEDEQNVRRIQAEYEDWLEQAEKMAAQMCQDAQKLRETNYATNYVAACTAQEKADSIVQYISAVKQFEALGDYQDSAARAESCRKMAEQLKAIQEKEDEARKVRNNRLAIVVPFVAIVMVLFGIVVTQVIVPGNKYRAAEELLAAGDFEGAAVAFAALRGYKDSEDRILEVYYKAAEALLAAGDFDGAAISFGKLSEYQDARERSMTLWNEIAPHTIVTGDKNTAGLRANGIVAVVGANDYGQCYVGEWRDIVAVSAGAYHTVGVCMDGTVVATGANDYGQCDVDGWRDIMAVSAGTYHTVGLRTDGTVVATGYNDYGQCDVDKWTDIVAVSAGSRHTVGLRADGTVVATGYNGLGQCDVDGWTDIMAVSVGTYHTVGLRADGTVVATGKNDDGQCNVDGWTDIAVVSAGAYHTVGLRTDGTVVTTGYNDYGQCNANRWTDIKVPD